MDEPLKVIFMGTPDFAVPALERILADTVNYKVVAVYTRAPKPKGRGYEVQKSPIHHLADEYEIPVYTPKSFRKDKDAVEEFLFHDVDVAVVAAYGLILTKEILEHPRFGCINIHGSLLPRWRGAAPIHRAIEAGDKQTGITIMQMDEGLDTGAMIMDGVIEITESMTTGELHGEMAELGGTLIEKALLELHEKGELQSFPQPDEGACHADKVTKEECEIKWSFPAEFIERKIRAFNPFPVCYTLIDGERVKIYLAEMAEGTGNPGEVLDDNLTVACGNSAIRILELQRPGKKRMSAEESLRGVPIAKGTVLGK